MTATLLDQYTHPGILAGSQGSVQLLANGNVFVGWGEVPRVSEFDHAGRLVFDALLGEKYECYRAFRLPWTRPPGRRRRRSRSTGTRPRADGLRELERRDRGARWQLLAGERERRAARRSRACARAALRPRCPQPRRAAVRGAALDARVRRSGARGRRGRELTARWRPVSPRCALTAAPTGAAGEVRSAEHELGGAAQRRGVAGDRAAW